MEWFCGIQASVLVILLPHLRVLLDRLKIYENFDALDKARAEHNVTLGLIKPARVTALRIQKSASQAWTSEEIDKLQSTSG